MEWNAQVVRYAPCVIGGVEGAAALAVTVALIGGAMQTHPYTHHLMARFN
jgi:hypothetical protein